MDSWHSGPAWHVLPCFPNQVFNHYVRQPLAKPSSLYLITAWVPHTLSYNIGCWLGWKGGFRLSSQQLLRWLGLLIKTPLQSRSQTKFQYTFLPWWNLSWPGSIVPCSGYQIWYWLQNAVETEGCFQFPHGAWWPMGIGGALGKMDFLSHGGESKLLAVGWGSLWKPFCSGVHSCWTPESLQHGWEVMKILRSQRRTEGARVVYSHIRVTKPLY